MVPSLMTSTAPRSAGSAVLRHSRSLRTTLVLLALWAGLALYPETREAFLTPGNLSNITAQVAEIVIISVGMTFVVLTGGIDLSVGAAMALFGVIAATLSRSSPR
jgi:ribose/xylose/arabinose/galactoside ABC-type transport system permease subunit